MTTTELLRSTNFNNALAVDWAFGCSVIDNITLNGHLGTYTNRYFHKQIEYVNIQIKHNHDDNCKKHYTTWDSVAGFMLDGGLHCDTFIFSRQLNNKNRCLPEPHTRRYLYMQQKENLFLSAHSDLKNVIITSYGSWGRNHHLTIKDNDYYYHQYNYYDHIRQESPPPTQLYTCAENVTQNHHHHHH